MKMKWKGILFAVLISVYFCHLTNAGSLTANEYDTYATSLNTGIGGNINVNTGGGDIFCSEPTFQGVEFTYKNADEYGVEKKKFYEGETVSFSCRSGFYLYGPSSSTCYLGVWDVVAQENHPRCVGKYGVGEQVDGDIFCSEPTFNADGVEIIYENAGEHGVEKKFYNGETVTFSCRSGFYLYGPSSSTCVDGVWGVADVGPQCIDENECFMYTAPCHGNKLCVNTEGSFECVCPAGYVENEHGNCQEKITDYCSNYPCGTNKECYNTEGGFSCVCPPGYLENQNGDCQEKITDHCSSYPCGTNKACYNTEGGFNCLCPPGYLENENGVCQEKITDHCSSYPCGTNKACYNTEGGFNCLCPPGYLENENGVCQEMKDACSKNPCGTNEVCVVLPGKGMYDCSCPMSMGYIRDQYGNCDEMNACHPSPCGTNEACMVLPGSGMYRCDCPISMGYFRDQYGVCRESTTPTTDSPSTTTTETASPVIIEHAGFMKEIMEVVNKYYIPRDLFHFGGYKYIYKKERMTFKQAKDYCALKGGHVAFVNMKTQAQRKKVFKMFPEITNNPTWVGALQLQLKMGRHWFYINFKPVNHATFGWNHGEPNNWRKKRCAVNHRSGKVNSAKCSFKMQVLCEVKLN